MTDRESNNIRKAFQHLSRNLTRKMTLWGVAVSTPRMPTNTYKSRIFFAAYLHKKKVEGNNFVLRCHTKKGIILRHVNTPWSSSVPKRIEDAMRRDTAPLNFGARRFRDSFRHDAFGGLCLAFLWSILFDLGRC